MPTPTKEYSQQKQHILIKYLNTKRHLRLRWGLSEVALSFGFGILPRMDLT